MSAAPSTTVRQIKSRGRENLWDRQEAPKTQNRVDPAAVYQRVYLKYTDVRRGCSHSVACLCYRTHTLCLSRTRWRGKVLKCANLLPLWLPHVSTVTFKCNKFPPIKQRVANLFHYELMGDIMGMVLLL